MKKLINSLIGKCKIAPSIASPSILVLIDAENFIYSVSRILGIARIDILDFDISYLCKQLFPKGVKLEIKYYGSSFMPNPIQYMKHHPLLQGVREEQLEKIQAWQNKMQEKINLMTVRRYNFRQSLIRQGIKFVNAGRLVVGVNEKTLKPFLQEKSVDVHLAFELTDVSQQREVYFISSDLDFLSAFRRARAKVTYVSFYDREHWRTNADLLAEADAFTYFDHQDVIEAYNRLNPETAIKHGN